MMQGSVEISAFVSLTELYVAHVVFVAILTQTGALSSADLVKKTVVASLVPNGLKKVSQGL